MTVLVLGPPAVLIDGQPRAPRRRMARDLLGLFALRPNQPIRAERIHAVLWPEAAPASAAANVRSHVTELRRLMVAGGTGTTLRSGPFGYELVAAPEAVDASQFRRSVGQARALALAGQAGEALSSYRRSLALWRGPVLDGAVVLAPVQGVVAGLEELRMAVAEEMTTLRLALWSGARAERTADGSPADLVPLLRGLIAEHPLRERLWSLLLQVLVAAGRRGEVAACYRELARLLDAELGVAPSAEATRLYLDALS